MKTRSLVLAAFLALTPGFLVLAEEPAMKCKMCEMMEKKKQAAAAAHKAKHDFAAQSAELDKLVAAMNGSLGREKVEAMAAVLTRLVEWNKQLQKQINHGLPTPKPETGEPAAGVSETAAPKEEPPVQEQAHEH